MKHRPVILVLALVCAAGTAFGEDAPPWPGYLGPTRDGRADAGGLLDGRRVVGLEIAWRAPLGSGYSGIAADGVRLYTLHSEGDSDAVVGIDLKTGKKLWSFPLAPAHRGTSGSSDGPLSTPAVGDGTVYALGPEGHLAAVDAATGKPRWRRNIVVDLGAGTPAFGIGTSPLVAGDLLIVQIGKQESRTACAFLRADGEVQWCAGDAAIGYQSPVLVPLLGRRQVIAVSDTVLFGIDPPTGDILWSHTYEKSGGEGGSHPIMIGDNRILIEGGNGFALYDFSGKPEAPSVKMAWENNRLKRSFDIPVHHEGYLYGHSRDTFVCLDAANGDLKWRSEIPGEGVAILIGDYLAIWSLENGTLHLVKASPGKYDEIASRKILRRGSYSTPAYAGGVILLRTLSSVAAVRIVTGDS